MIKTVKMKIPKALTRDSGIWLPKTVGAMEQIGKMAVLMIKKRIKTKGVDGMGKKAKRLKSTGWFFTAPSDTRFTGKVKKIGGKGGAPPILVHFNGYKSLKRAMGAKPKADGTLTGAMWDGLAPKLKKVRGGWEILIRFYGSQVTGAKPTGDYKKSIKKKRRKGRVVSVKVTRIPKIKKVRTPNKIKAKSFQQSAGVALLSLTQKERQYLMDMYLKLVKQLKPYK
tara:strand:+ start:583 stop:1257 length:675 start_codon:yes stop_codon:yes gene_type:complete